MSFRPFQPFRGFGGGAVTVGTAWDADAAVYLANGESLDGEPLELAKAEAFNDFFIGLKLDPSPIAATSWAALKASCAMVGWRTLSAALQPLHPGMPAPSNFNFVAGDYSRTLGLIGNGSTKALNSNRNCNADPQDNQLLAVWMTQANSSVTSAGIIGAGTNTSGATHILVSTGNLSSRNRSSSEDNTGIAITGITGFVGISRSGSANYSRRFLGSTSTIGRGSTTPQNDNYGVFSRLSGGSFGTYSNARMSFYGIGESADLTTLDARLTTLMAALA